LDNVRCNSTELSIINCQHNSWGNHSCQHNDDVSVSCIADSAEAVALVGGRNPRVGRLEVFRANQWGTVCDNGFTTQQLELFATLLDSDTSDKR